MFIYISGVWQIGCCQVLSSTDVNIAKIITDICNRVDETTDKKLKLEKCYLDIFNKCAINITHLINVNEVGSVLYNRQLIDQIKSLNGSLCLKYHYGVSLTSLGATHRLKDNDQIMSKEVGTINFI